MTRAHKNKGGKRIHGLLTQEPSQHRTLSVLLITKGKQIIESLSVAASLPPPPPPPQHTHTHTHTHTPPPPPPPARLRRGYENTRRVHSPSRGVGLQECLVCES